jgi:acyl carrier protein
LPSRREWEAIAQDAARADKLKKQIQALLELEALGARVLPVSADIADSQQLRTVLQRAEKQFGVVNGVVHAAGIAGVGLIASKTRKQMDEVLRSKVGGAHALAEVFANHPLDFMVCCSSLQSIFGDYGQSDYCAANAFLDAFAYASKRKLLQPSLTINWDTWTDTGLAAKAAVVNNSIHEFSHRGLSSAECISHLSELLPMALPQVLVCAADIQQRLQEDSREGENKLAVAETPDRRVARHPRPELFTPFVEPGTRMECVVARIWEHVLGVEGIGLDDSLFELGGDSVSAIRVSQALQEATGTSVPPARIFTATTVRSLARLVAGTEVESPASLRERQSRGERRRAIRMQAQEHDPI